MFIGQYEHQLEEKGRLSVPKKFRVHLEKGAVLSQGLDGCLFLYTRDSWDSLIAKVNSLPLTKADARGFARNLSYTATEVEIDSLGRILIPEYLRSLAGIKKECIVAGSLDRIEIWDKSKYSEYVTKTNSRIEEIAEKLSESGVL